MSESSIRLLTLNCWGLKYIAKDRVLRIEAITFFVSQSNYDIVTLQELWVFADYEYVRKCVASRLPYAKFFYSGALGSGLAIFSRFPIVTASIHPYSLNGHPVDVSAGDWFVGKAAASIIIRHPLLKEVEIFNTHLFAKGGEDGPEHRRAHRLVNAWEFAKLVRNSASMGRYVIAAGDFNSIPTTLPITIIRGHAGLADAWEASHTSTSSSNISPVNMSPADAIALYGVTADSPLNSYSADKPLDATALRFLGKRLDYIFYREPEDPFISERPVLKCSQSNVVLSEKVSGTEFSFSDHFGLEAAIDIVSPYENESTQQRRSLSQRLSPLADDVFATIIQALTGCYRLSTERSRVELTTFAGCIAMLVALCIGSAWLPPLWINPILVLLIVFISWLGTTMLYAGFIYGNWERRALMNVIEELELIKQSNTQDTDISATPMQRLESN